MVVSRNPVVSFCCLQRSACRNLIALITSMDKTEEYQLIKEIVEAGSLTSAAHKLNLSRSAVSKKLSALEERLGVKLVDRSTKSLAITDRGRLFYEKAIEILNSISALEDLLLEHHDQVEGRIHVSMPKVLVSSRYLKQLSAFFRQNPRLKLDLTISDKLDNLIDQRIDFAFRVGNLDDSRLYARKIGQTKTIICASRQYIESTPTLNTVTDAVHHTILLPSYINLANNPVWQHLKSLFKPENTHFVDDANALVELAKGGAGIAVILDVAAEDAFANGELIQLFPDFSLNTMDISLVYPSQRNLSRRLLLFKDFFGHQ